MKSYCIPFDFEVPYLYPRSTLQRLASASLHLPSLLVFDRFPEVHSLSVQLYDSYQDSTAVPAHRLHLTIRSRSHCSQHYCPKTIFPVFSIGGSGWIIGLG